MTEPDPSIFPETTTVTLPDTARRSVITGVGVIAPSEWPIIDLIELIGTLYASSPSTFLNAAVSWMSFCLVPEP